MIKLTMAQIDTLIERGYKNVVYSQTGDKNNGPWYKEYENLLNGMSKFEIIINPYGMWKDIIVGCTGEADSDDDDGEFESFIDMMDVFEELKWLKQFLIDSAVVIR